MRLSRLLFVRRSFASVYEPAAPITSHLGKYSKDYSNLPERYIVRKSTRLLHKSEDNPAVLPKLVMDHSASYTVLDRPWTDAFWSKVGTFAKGQGDIVEPIREEDWMWFRGDRVEVLVGDDKGKQGYICQVIQERNWVLVEGLNCKFDHIGQDKDFPGVMSKVEKPLLVPTEIKLVDPSDEQATDVEWRFTEDGQRVRVSQRTGIILPFPTKAAETIDYKTKAGYVENKAKDTVASDVEEITYEPKLCTFDMDIVDHLNIKEDRVPTRTYWY